MNSGTLQHIRLVPDWSSCCRLLATLQRVWSVWQVEGTVQPLLRYYHFSSLQDDIQPQVYPKCQLH